MRISPETDLSKTSVLAKAKSNSSAWPPSAGAPAAGTPTPPQISESEAASRRAAAAAADAVLASAFPLKSRPSAPDAMPSGASGSWTPRNSIPQVILFGTAQGSDCGSGHCQCGVQGMKARRACKLQHHVTAHPRNTQSQLCLVAYETYRRIRQTKKPSSVTQPKARLLRMQTLMSVRQESPDKLRGASVDAAWTQAVVPDLPSGLREDRNKVATDIADLVRQVSQVD